MMLRNIAAHLLVVLLSLSTACAKSPDGQEHKLGVKSLVSKSEPANPMTDAEGGSLKVIAKFSDVFKTGFVISKELAQNPLPIDLDGDGKIEELYIVSVNDSAESLNNIQVIYPWPVDEENRIADNAVSGAKNNFAVINSKNGRAYLIADKNTISVLDTEAAKKLQYCRTKKLNQLKCLILRVNQREIYW